LPSIVAREGEHEQRDSSRAGARGESTQKFVKINSVQSEEEEESKLKREMGAELIQLLES